MFKSLFAAVAALFLSSSLGLAQTANTPRFYVAGHYPGAPTGIFPSAPHPYLTSMVWTSCLKKDPTNTYWITRPPSEAAADTFNEVQRRLNANSPELLPGQIAIWLWNFGYDSGLVPSASLPNEQVWYYRQEDRLPLNWFGDGDFPQHEYRDARRYLHPFLSNAVCTAPCTVPIGMRSWMQQYIAAYEALRGTDARFIPSRFYFDNENYLAAPSNVSPNAVFIRL